MQRFYFQTEKDLNRKLEDVDLLNYLLIDCKLDFEALTNLFALINLSFCFFRWQKNLFSHNTFTGFYF